MGHDICSGLTSLTCVVPIHKYWPTLPCLLDQLFIRRNLKRQLVTILKKVLLPTLRRDMTLNFSILTVFSGNPHAISVYSLPFIQMTEDLLKMFQKSYKPSNYLLRRCADAVIANLMISLSSLRVCLLMLKKVLASGGHTRAEQWPRPCCLMPSL